MFLTSKGCCELAYCLLTDRILDVEIVLGHVDVGVADDTLNGGKINTQRLQLADIGVPTAVGCQDTYPFNFTNGSLELVPEVGWVTGLIFFACLPDKGPAGGS